MTEIPERKNPLNRFFNVLKPRSGKPLDRSAGQLPPIKNEMSHKIFYKLFLEGSVILDISCATEIGKYPIERLHNQDTVSRPIKLEANIHGAKTPVVLFGVFDGVGGNPQGEVASTSAANGQRDSFIQTIQDLGSTTDIPLALRSSMKDANQRVIIDGQSTGMKTAGIVVAVWEEPDRKGEVRAAVANASDSRTYIYRKKEDSITQITTDLTIAEALNRGLITQEFVNKYNFKNSDLYSYLGSPDPLIDVFPPPGQAPITLNPGDILLTCSDGLSKALGDQSILEFCRTEKDPATLTETLIDAAQNNGGKDDISAVVVIVNEVKPGKKASGKTLYTVREQIPQAIPLPKPPLQQKLDPYASPPMPESPIAPLPYTVGEQIPQAIPLPKPDSVLSEQPSILNVPYHKDIRPEIRDFRGNMRIMTSWETDIGTERENNEDTVLPPSFLTVPINGSETSVILAGVFDGVGGYNDGEVASALAANEVRNTFIENIRDILTPSRIPLILLQSLRQANITVSEQKKPESHGMGTTATVFAVWEEAPGDVRAAVANAGDSRTYLYHEGRLMQITEDHSSAAQAIREVREGRMTEEQARAVPRNKITSYLGKLHTQIDIFGGGISEPIILGPGDMLLACSDGLSGMVRDEQILEFCRAYKNPAELTSALIKAANANGGKDNISAVVAVVDEVKPDKKASGKTLYTVGKQIPQAIPLPKPPLPLVEPKPLHISTPESRPAHANPFDGLHDEIDRGPYSDDDKRHMHGAIMKTLGDINNLSNLQSSLPIDIRAKLTTIFYTLQKNNPGKVFSFAQIDMGNGWEKAYEQFKFIIDTCGEKWYTREQTVSVATLRETIKKIMSANRKDMYAHLKDIPVTGGFRKIIIGLYDLKQSAIGLPKTP